MNTRYALALVLAFPACAQTLTLPPGQSFGTLPDGTTCFYPVAGFVYGITMPPCSTPAPVPKPITDAPFAVFFAAGLPTTAPRHAAAAVGIIQAIATNQDFFLSVLVGPQPGTDLDQESAVLGIRQHLGPITVFGVPLESWASAAFGTALSNVSKLNLSTTATAAVVSASTNPAFQAQYVLGFGTKPTWCARCEIGPLARYIHTAGQPSQVLIGMYLSWGH
jgi:hypothetical protein